MKGHLQTERVVSWVLTEHVGVYLEHGAAGLGPVVAPELIGQVARGRGGDEVPHGLGD